MVQMKRNGVTKEWKENDIEEMQLRGWVLVEEKITEKEVKRAKSIKFSD